MKVKSLFSYENKLLVLISFTFGFVLFDRMALSFLVPFFDKELNLNNTHIGLLNSALSLTWAISGYMTGTLSDKTGKRKLYLIIATVVFSICSFMSGLATSFLFLLFARSVMGLAEGPVMPLAQSIMIESSTEKRRGFNMGFIQNFGVSIMGMFAPLILVVLATNFGWRYAFFIAGVPGLILAVLGFFYIKEAKTNVGNEKKEKASLTDLLKYRNIWVTILLGSCMLTWLSVQIAFLPKYLISIKHFTEAEMGITMSAFGLGSVVWGIVIPALSDRFGRKPIVIISLLLSVIMPLGMIYQEHGFMSLLVFMLLGSCMNGCVPIVLSTIPAETVPRPYIAQTLGLVMGIAEIVGGFIALAVTGWLADLLGMHIPFLIAAGAAFCAGLIAFLLFETAPLFTNKKIVMSDVS